MPMTTDKQAAYAIPDRRWVSLGYAIFVLSLICYEYIRVPNEFSSVLTLLCVLLVAAPITGAMPTARASWQYVYNALLLVFDIALAFGIIILSGGYASPLWMVLLVPLSAAPMLFDKGVGVAIGIMLWFMYGLSYTQAPRDELMLLLSEWLMRGAAVGMGALVLQLTLNAQAERNRRSRRRERALEQFLRVSNNLRASSTTQSVLEEVAGAVQEAGEFDCVTFNKVDWKAAQVTVVVAIGASKKRLPSVEGLKLPWSKFQPMLEEGNNGGRVFYWSTKLPFRSIKHEIHLLLPLASQFGEMHGLMTVTAHERHRQTLAESRPLLELLANQAAVALDNAELFNTLDQRVQAATATLQKSTDELRVARDRAETLYRISRALSVTLDEHQVLEQALALIVQATGADRGGIVLLDPKTKRLAFRTTLDRQQAGSVQGLERALGLANWVLQKRKATIVPDTSVDPRWQVANAYDNRPRSVLAVPLSLDQEVLGVLLLIHNHTKHFTVDHAQLALAAASQIAVTLSKAHLYRYVSEQGERLGHVAQQREEEASKSLAILRSIGDGVIVGDRMGRVRLINPAAEQILGIQATTFIGRALADLPGALDDEGSDSAGLRQITIGERTLRAHLSPVLSSKSEWLGSVVVYHDITREVLADKLKSEFVATASHELRTPLTSMRGYVDMLLMGTCGPLSDTQRDFVKIIKNNVQRLMVLINELLDMSRAEAGEVRLRRELVDMGEMLIDVSRDLYSQFQERKIVLALDVQDNLPAVQVDRQRIRQVVTNLLGNACKYTPMGGQVWVGLHNGNGELRVDFRDTGVGIAREYQQHIFTPFYRADNPLRDEVGGTGLGLSITRKLVELHGGRIWFESVEGQGSVFSFTIPLIADQRWKKSLTE